jgi:hypothetical protein
VLARSEVRQRDAELRRGRERLGDDAVPFRQPQQSLERQADRANQQITALDP